MKQDVNIVPNPQFYELLDGSFTLNKHTVVCFEGNDKQVNQVIDMFCKKIEHSTGFELEQTSSLRKKNIIHLILSPNDSLGAEGYTLKINKKNIIIQASTAAGLFYGTQSLLQLFPPDIFSETVKENIRWEAPCIRIIDKPNFSYRGAHLDVARHFASVDSIKRYIDYLAMYKMNRFHWHLTDDQGWRIEIKKYPKLTEIGGCRKETLIGSYADVPQRFDGKPHCGYYTQEEAREIVRYAAERFITVIPEIEMPGHALAALSAYPELSCDPKKTYEAGTYWGVFDDVFCPSDTTFAFLKNVLLEIMDIFPSKYINIGGDECPKKTWKESRLCQDLMKKQHLKTEEELQHYFIETMAAFLSEHGREAIGWDEIMEGGLKVNATILSWRGLDMGLEAAKQGHDVIMAPTSHCYLDYYQADPAGEPLAIGGFVTINKVYHLNPIPEGLPADKAHHVIGIQSNLWTEYITSFKKAEYMLFPRLLAIAEVAWTKPERKNWDDFCRRLPYQLRILDAMGISYGTVSFNIQFKSNYDSAGTYTIALSSEIAGSEIAYTTDGSDPNLNSPRYKEPIKITQSCMIKAVPIFHGEIKGKPVSKEVHFHKAIGKKISYQQEPDKKFPAGGPTALIDGLTGSNNFADGFWQGFFGYDCVVTIDLENPQKISTVSSGVLQSSTHWILYPSDITVSASNDSLVWKTLGKVTNDVAPSVVGQITKVYSITNTDETPYRYLRVALKNPKISSKIHKIPEGTYWLFADEIMVE